MNPEDEAYAAKLLERMKQQNQMMAPDTSQNPDQSPENIANVLNRGGRPPSPQTDINSQAMLSSIENSSPAAPASGAWAECPQCGVMHPPVPAGQICPNARVEIKEAGIRDEDINVFLSTLKNITVSQIQSKEITDGNKLFKSLTIELTKFLEGYSE